MLGRKIEPPSHLYGRSALARKASAGAKLGLGNLERQGGAGAAGRGGGRGRMSAARAWRSAADFLAAPRVPKLRGPDIINLVGLLTLVLFTALSSTRSGVPDDLGGECDVADEGEEWANAVSASTSGGVDGRFWTGVALSVVADAAIAISLNVQKLAHNRNQGPDGKPIKPYVQVPMWWAGMILNILGEAGNGLAYGFSSPSSSSRRSSGCATRAGWSRWWPACA